MKILQLTSSLGSAGGIESYVNVLSEALVKNGHTLMVMGGNGSSRSETGYECKLVEGYHEYGASAARTNEALQAAARFSPDLVHLQGVTNCELARKLVARWPTVKHAHTDFTCAAGGGRFFRRSRTACSRTFGLPCLWHFYAGPCGISRNPVISLWSYRRTRAALNTWPRLTRILANSNFVKASLVKAGVPEKQIRVLHYFTGSPEVDRSAGKGVTATNILFAGRVTPGKGLEDLLRACQVLNTQYHLTVVGNGISMENCHRLSAELDLSERVNFVGWQTDLEPYYRNASLVVVPSLWPEPFGIVGIEAMSYGLPVVAYRSGGIPEWLDDGVTGTLVAPGNISGLAASIDGLLSDPKEARKRGEAGRRRQHELFSAENHIRQLEKIYEEAIRDWRPA